jgi:hypothetical protein
LQRFLIGRANNRNVNTEKYVEEIGMFESLLDIRLEVTVFSLANVLLQNSSPMVPVRFFDCDQ